MVTINYAMYFCFLIPIILSLFIMENKSRLMISFIMIGMTVCLVAAELNASIYQALDRNKVYYTTTISPIIEEVLKAIPILIYALIRLYDRSKIAQLSFAVGLGFAIMENLIMLTERLGQGYTRIDISWAIMRGFGASLMHSICTVIVGLGIYYVKIRKKTFYCGTFSLIMLAITYHSIYNTLVLSSYSYLGIMLPLCTYIPILLFYGKRVG